MERNYRLTDETIIFKNRTLYRIEATKDFADIKKGDKGGFIEKYENLGDNAWVYDNTKVFEDARVLGNARVYENARVYGNARVFGNARVCENARVFGNARVCENARVFEDARVYGNARVYGDAKVYEHAKVYGNAIVYGYARVLGKAKVYEHVEVFGYAEFFGKARVYGDAKVCENARVYGNAIIHSNNDYCTFSNFGSVNRTTTFFKSKKGILVNCGCFKGTLQEFEKKVKETHKGNKHEREYLKMIELVEIKFKQ